MLGLLKNLVELIGNIPGYILYAVESFYNLFIAALHVIFTAATSLIPLPSEPALPELVQNINWFFPIGSIVSIMTPVVAGYVTFLAIRWIFQKTGNL
jgi:hypothetical protein